jgi:hypothetical protein
MKNRIENFSTTECKKKTYVAWNENEELDSLGGVVPSSIMKSADFLVSRPRLCKCFA